MQNVVDPTQIFESIKLFMEFGGTYSVGDTDKLVYREGREQNTKELVGLLINKRQQSIMVFHDRMTAGDWTILNPYVETIGNSPERVFFFRSISVGLSMMVKAMIARIVELTINKNQEDIDYDKLHLVTSFKDKIDDNTADELAVIKMEDILKIFYDNKKRVAQLQSDIFDQEVMDKYGKKIRKKTWSVLQSIVQEFFQTEKVEQMYEHKGEIIGAQEADAVLHIFVKACEAIHEYAKLLLGQEIPVADMIKHVDLLEVYHKASAWFTSSSSTPEPKTITAEPPWRTGVLPASSTASTMPKTFVPVGSVNNHIVPANLPFMQPQTQQAVVPVQGRALPFVTPDEQRQVAMYQQNRTQIRYADSPPPSIGMGGFGNRMFGMGMTQRPLF